jgi:hypothetical protein
VFQFANATPDVIRALSAKTAATSEYRLGQSQVLPWQHDEMLYSRFAQALTHLCAALAGEAASATTLSFGNSRLK